MSGNPNHRIRPKNQQRAECCRSIFVCGILALWLGLLSGCLRQGFSPKVASTEAPNAESFTFQAFGDLMLGGRAADVLTPVGFEQAFVPLRGVLAAADLNMVNLECPITDRGFAMEGKQYTFRMAPKTASVLRNQGIGLVSLANNHSMDFGWEGLAQTISLLEAHGIGHAGAGEDLKAARRPVIREAHGIRLGVLAYSLTFPETYYAEQSRPGTAFGHKTDIEADVAQLRSQVDLVVVSFHWGAELRKDPKEYQVELAHAAIDAGADLIVGHHPHVVQSVEVYKAKPIFYSLGNFIFGSYSNSVQWGLGIRVTWPRTPKGVSRIASQVEMRALDINNFRRDFVPIVLEGEASHSAWNELRDLSKPFSSEFQVREDGVAILPVQP